MDNFDRAKHREYMRRYYAKHRDEWNAYQRKWRLNKKAKKGEQHKMAEKRLIDAKPLMENGWHLVKTGESNRFLTSMSLADVPTVDAVEVVRCCLCKHWDVDRLYCHHPAGLSFCGKTGAAKGFCCFGERRTDVNL